jgi:hypothetical protein
MERVGTGHDAGPAGRATRELDRGLDGFRAGIGEEHLVQVWHMLKQAFRQHAGQRGDIQLHQIGQIAVEDALERLAQRRMIATNRKNAKSAQ